MCREKEREVDKVCVGRKRVCGLKGRDRECVYVERDRVCV